MLINPFTGIVNSALSGSQKTNEKIQTAVAQLSAGERITKASQDVAALSVATQLQNQVSSLRTALGNTAESASLLQIADNDIGQIQDILGRLNDIAVKANSGVQDDSGRAAQDIEFQSLVDEINRISGNSTFNNKKLLDGSLSGENSLSLNAILGEPGADGDNTLAIDSLDSSSLLGADINVRSQSAAQDAIAAIQQALNNAGTARAGVGAFQQEIDIASAYIESAIFNQEAARSTLADADFLTAATELSQASVQRDAQIGIQAQSKRLPPSMLELLS